MHKIFNLLKIILVKKLIIKKLLIGFILGSFLIVNSPMAYAKFHPIRTAIKVAAIVKLYTTAQKGFRLAKAIELGIENPQIISSLIAVSVVVAHKVAEETQKCMSSDKCPVPKDKAAAFNKILQDKFAEHSIPYPIYDGDDTIPPLGKDEQDTSIPDYNKDPSEHNNHLITTPTGEQIDPREEFPMEDIKTYDDYILAKSNSKTLEENLIKAGHVKPPNTAAHHIIPITAKRAAGLRQKAINAGIDLNGPINGIFLHNGSGKDVNGKPLVKFAQGIIHNGRHPDEHIDSLEAFVDDYILQHGPSGVKIALQKAYDILQTAPDNADWRTLF